MKLSQIQKMYDAERAKGNEPEFILDGDSREIRAHFFSAMRGRMTHFYSFEGAF